MSVSPYDKPSDLLSPGHQRTELPPDEAIRAIHYRFSTWLEERRRAAVGSSGSLLGGLVEPPPRGGKEIIKCWFLYPFVNEVITATFGGTHTPAIEPPFPTIPAISPASLSASLGQSARIQNFVVTYMPVRPGQGYPCLFLCWFRDESIALCVNCLPQTMHL